jgi:hypothetical protein
MRSRRSTSGCTGSFIGTGHRTTVACRARFRLETSVDFPTPSRPSINTTGGLMSLTTYPPCRRGTPFLGSVAPRRASCFHAGAGEDEHRTAVAGLASRAPSGSIAARCSPRNACIVPNSGFASRFLQSGERDLRHRRSCVASPCFASSSPSGLTPDGFPAPIPIPIASLEGHLREPLRDLVPCL